MSQVVDDTSLDDGAPRRAVTLQASVGNALGNAVDAVEAALAHALKKASAAGQWALVGQLAKELEARRLARGDGKVVPLYPRARSRPHP
jgi:hypothetical protein